MMECIFDVEQPIAIPCGDVQLDGLLHIPRGAKGMVIFAHGSGSSRLSPRNQYIAKVLQHATLATLLFDLLTPEEDEVDTQTAQFRFDIEFLARRLLLVTDWLSNHPLFNQLPTGYFGASTGGGAALLAAAKKKHRIKAVVSRGGRPDLAIDALPDVTAATLLIVGGDDEMVIQLNQKALKALRCIKKLEIVAGATHLFEEPGKLAEVAQLAEKWFNQHLI